MAKDFKNFRRDFERAMRDIGFMEACLIVDEALKEMDDYIDPNVYDTGHLADSGFGYVNGRLVAETDRGRDESELPITEPENINVTNPGSDHYDITISYHTPRPWKKGPNGYFDYAPYVLEPPGGYHGFVKSEQFRSRRVAALRGMAHKPDVDPERLRLSIERGIAKGVSEAAARIVFRLSRL